MKESVFIVVVILVVLLVFKKTGNVDSEMSSPSTGEPTFEYSGEHPMNDSMPEKSDFKVGGNVPEKKLFLESSPSETSFLPLSEIDYVEDLLVIPSEEIPDLCIEEVENCPNGCCALKALSNSTYPTTPVKFPLLEPNSGYNCAYCEESVDRLSTPMVANLNGTPVVFCSTGCYSYILSAPVQVLKKYRELHGIKNQLNLVSEK